MARELDALFGQAAFGATASLGSNGTYLEQPQIKTSAASFAATVLERIQDFERSLGREREVTVQLANFGKPMQMTLTHISYAEPSLVVFHGHSLDGKPVQLVQHASQLSFALASAPLGDTSGTRQPISLIARAA